MAKADMKTVFVCHSCGATSPKWLGRCSECGEWDAYEERSTKPQPASRPWQAGEPSEPVELASLGGESFHRLTLPFRELNRVLGGGIVPGSLTLIGGDPGIGKSTLLLQMAQAVASEQGRVVYISGEESVQQIRLRAQRLGLSGERLLLLPETDLDRALHHLSQTSPAMAVVDSIQTMCVQDVSGGAGSVSQVRECSLRLMQWAKSTDVPVFIAGHVTKEGNIAGPKVLEHMVDVVLYLEGEGFSPFRILRGVKNRFGSTYEVGIFEMGEAGLAEVENPSSAFLAHRRESAPGSAIVPTLEGSRPLLVEVQALVTPTSMPAPRRVANGVDFNRLLLVIAVLSKHLGLSIASQDILVNVVGGLRVSEPAADAAVALAVVSSLRDQPAKPGHVAVGEVGLAGELRPVQQMDRRIAEAAALGFQHCIVPSGALDPSSHKADVDIIEAGTLKEAIALGLERRTAAGAG